MHIKSSDRLGEVQEYYFSKKLREVRDRRASGEQIINLGIGSPDLEPHPNVMKALEEGLKLAGAHQYQSYQGIPALREAYANYYERHHHIALDPASEILPLIGSKEGVMHLSMSLLNKEDEVLVPNPGYGSYASCAHLAEANVRPYELNEIGGWLPDLEKLANTDLSNVKIMWVNYPHMPTGAVASQSFFERLIAFGRQHKILICNDNPYAHILTKKPLSIMSIKGAKDTACELTSLSKAFNMAGWRMGALVGDQALIQTVLRFKSNMDSGMFKPAQLAAAAALSLGEEWFNQQNNIYRKRQKVGVKLLEALGCEPIVPDAGMFVLGKVPTKYEGGMMFSDMLLDEFGLFIPPASIFGSAGKPFVRLSLCTPTEIFVDIIKKVNAKKNTHVSRV